MDLHGELKRHRKEHDEVLRFLTEFDGALARAAAESDRERCAGLAQLSKMEEKLAEIREHCREEEQSIESPFQLYLDDYALEDLQIEHKLLERHSHDFCAELTAVTAPPPTETLVRLGQRLGEQLRRHIAREEELLKQIEEGSAAEQRLFLRYIQPGE